ncbi:MAG: 16S rRNA (cytidine(1402)-2'-O)-methyltransferase [Candidatus Taylorbacteria bacterium]
MSTFYVVATPIGNMEDITLRALRVLGSVDVVLCEDTRVTKKLFVRHNVATGGEGQPRVLSYHAHSKISRVNDIIALLKEGKNIALVSDAGTPGISDPGAELVSIIRREMVNELADGLLKIESVPGASALTGALSIAGVPCADFVFLGFLPHKKGRETLFKEIAASERTCIFYESPHRIMKTLESLVEHISNNESAEAGADINKKRVTVCRELTKIFEEVVSGSPAEVLAYFTTHTDKVRGEFVVIVS